MQDKLVGDQPLTPERTEEKAKTMDRNGCNAPVPRPVMLVFPTRAVPLKDDPAASRSEPVPQLASVETRRGGTPF